MSVDLRERETLPPGFLDWAAPELHGHLGGPTLIHLAGERPQPLFVAMLLHGNETTGLHAVQALLRPYAGRRLPRALSLFVANTEAAAAGRRHLPGQPDWNRIWPVAGAPPTVAACAEIELAAKVVAAMAARRPFAAVDVHNNNGVNPPYACINSLAAPVLQLARAFTRRVLYFTTPPGTLGQCFTAFAASLTLECGAVGDAAGVARASAFLDHCLRLEALDDTPPSPQAIDLYRSAARITVPDRFSIGRLGEQAALQLPADLETMNWRRQAVGTLLARANGVAGIPLELHDPAGVDCTARWLRRRAERLELARAATPAMLTLDAAIIRQDCLCYLLEPLD